MANKFLTGITIATSVGGEYTFPIADGSANQAIITDGNGNLSFGSAIASTAEDAQRLVCEMINNSGSTIGAFLPVCCVGIHSDGTPEIAPARSDNPLYMPAIGITQSSVGNNNRTDILLYGKLEDIDTTDYETGDTLYVAATGGWSTTRPTGNNLIQAVFKVGRIQQNNGSGGAFGAGQYEDLPNIGEGKVWIGNSSSYPVATSLSTAIPAALGYTPVTNSRTLTINGTTYDLSADRSWTIEAGGATASTRVIQKFTSTASQTTFTITGGYTVGMVDVWLNGVKLDNAVDFTASNGTTVVLASALTANQIVEVYKYGSQFIVNNGLRQKTLFTATAGQTTFTVAYSVGLVDVFYNGSKLDDSEYTATNGTSIVLNTACAVNDKVEVIAFSYNVNGFTGIGGSGTINNIPKFTATGTIGNSAITDDGTTVTLVSRALSGTSATFSGLVTGGGTIRATGATGGLSTGSGVEIRNNSSVGEVFAYNRSSSEYLPLRLDGSTLSINTITSGAITFGGAATFSSSVTATSFTDGYITISGAQINRPATVEMQFSGAGNVRFFGNTAYPITFTAGSGAASFSSSVTAGGNIGVSNGELYPRIRVTSTNVGSSAAGYEIADNSGTQWAIAYSKADSYLQFFKEGSGNRMQLYNDGRLAIGATASSWETGILRSIEIGQSGNFYAGFNGGSAIYMGTSAYYNNGWKYAVTGSGANLLDMGSGNFIFQNAPSGTAGNAITFVERMRITSDGKIAIGTTSTSHYVTISQPGSSLLTIDNSASGQYTELDFKRGGVNKAELYWDNNNSRFYVYLNANTGAYLNSGTWTSTSDERLKDIIEPIENAVEKLMPLRTVIGKFKNDETNRRKPFLIAQDVEKTFPDAISYSQIGKEGEEYLHMGYTDMIPLLVKAIQEQQAQIEELKAIVATK